MLRARLRARPLPSARELLPALTSVHPAAAAPHRGTARGTARPQHPDPKESRGQGKVPKPLLVL